MTGTDTYSKSSKPLRRGSDCWKPLCAQQCIGVQGRLLMGFEKRLHWAANLPVSVVGAVLRKRATGLPLPGPPCSTISCAGWLVDLHLVTLRDTINYD